MSAAKASSASALPVLLCVAAWTSYLPLAAQYLLYGACGLAALWAHLRGATATGVLRHPLFGLGVALWAWLLLSSAWSSAPRADVVAHAWSYSLMLWVPWIAMAAPPGAAQRALMHFVAVSSLVALAWLVEHAGWMAGWRWRPFVEVTGNQRIAFSLLLALAVALGLHRALQPRDARSRGLAAAAALLCLAGLLQQDRRTGVVVLPLLTLLVVLAHQRGWRRRALLSGAVVAAALALWQLSPTVQQRFAEGVAELQAYHAQGDVQTSWGMRLRMAQVTAEMTLEQPLWGHGLGSWPTEWRQRVHDGSLLQGHTTPHSEYLLVAFQGGAVAVLLLLALGTRAVGRAVQRHQAAVPALLVLAAMAWAGLFNVVLRDVKFALPLLSLAAMAWAAARAPAACSTMPAP